MAKARERRRIAVGDVIPEQELAGISGPIPIPDPKCLVHLQLRRFAGCQVCNLHLRSFVMRKDEILKAGIREIVVFHSTTEELRRYGPDLPFEMVADPAKRLYREFGVESSVWSVLNLRILANLPAFTLNGIRWVLRHHSILPLNPTGGLLGLPADFLIASDGRVIAVKYGKHADDQWSVDELLAHAARA
jgi:peroxiredoxin